ncbi:MAG: S-layer homology domain-containing protein [Oscillospiraceae bacterium]|nr:S-layer homology domain-containing protein [Oscillospiraceae bacterium]
MRTRKLQINAKRGLSLLLVLALLFSLVPLSAFADGEVPMEPVPGYIGIVPLTTEYVSTLVAWNAAIADITVTEIVLQADITLPGAVTIVAGRNLLVRSEYGELWTLWRTAGAARHFTVNGTLTLENVILSGNYPMFSGNHGGIQVNAGGSLIMEDGSAITRNRNNGNASASAVLVDGAGATFTMNGGEISYNSTLSITATSSSGSATVFVIGGAVFTMNDGVIRNNIGRFGGGVRIGQTAAIGGDNRMYMNDGEIYGNTAFFGGGVNLEFGTFTMTAGIIRDNIATAFQNDTALARTDGRGGGGVFIQNSGIFNMSGGVIHDNHSYTHGGGVMSGTPAANQFNMTGGTIRDNTADRRDIPPALATPTNTGGGVRMSNGVFTMGTATLEDGTITYGTITGNTATNDGGGIWIGAGTTIANARLNLNANIGVISNNTALYGDGGGIFTVANNGYPPSLLPTHYPNIIATAPLSVIFFGNVAGGGRFAPPLNPGARPFGGLLNNYAINYRGPNPEAYITFMLHGGYYNSSTTSVSFPIPLGGMVDPADIPTPPNLNRPLYTFLGWILRGDLTNTLLQADEIEDMTFTESTIFDAQWYPLNPIIITYLSGANGTFAGGGTSSTEVLAGPGYPIQAPTPVPHSGWQFAGWSRDGGTALLGTAEVMATFIDTNTTFTAQWEPSVTITYLSGTNGTFAPPGAPNLRTETIVGGGAFPNQVPTPIANNGWQFAGWLQAGGTTLFTTAQVEALFISDNTTFTAQWTQIGGGGWTPPARPARQAYLIGTEEGLIRPNANITRAEVATIFFRLISDADRKAGWSQTNPFSDVERNHWFNNAVSTTTRMKIFQGRPDGTFGPNEPITRAELATAVARFMDVAGFLNAGGNQFSDISGHWANAYINAAAMNRWVEGPDGLGGAFYPDRPITRAETAAIINRIFERLPETPADLLPDMITWPDNANIGAWFYLYLQSASNSYTFQRKPDGVHERWIAIIPVRDWAALERPNSTPGDILGG